MTCLWIISRYLHLTETKYFFIMYTLTYRHLCLFAQTNEKSNYSSIFLHLKYTNCFAKLLSTDLISWTGILDGKFLGNCESLFLKIIVPVFWLVFKSTRILVLHWTAEIPITNSTTSPYSGCVLQNISLVPKEYILVHCPWILFFQMEMDNRSSWNSMVKLCSTKLVSAFTTVVQLASHFVVK